MNEVQSMGFFLISSMLVVAVGVCFGLVTLFSYREKKAKENKELQEAARMFEQRIALRPKHMGARIGLGVAGDVHFDTTNSRKE